MVKFLAANAYMFEPALWSLIVISVAATIETTPEVSSFGALKFKIRAFIIGPPPVPIVANALRSITLAPVLIVAVDESFGKCNSARFPVVIVPPTDVTLSSLTIVVSEAVIDKSPAKVVPSISIVAALAAFTVNVAAEVISMSVA